jgi:type I restriction enzyme S subunit
LDWRDIPFSTFLHRVADPVDVDDATEYMQVRVSTKALGLSLRGTQPGAKIGTKRQTRVREGQWLMSKIDARNGAFGFVPEELDGAIVTQDFPAFAVDEEVVLPEFLRLYSSQPAFWRICEQASRGTTNRRRLDVDRFLAMTLRVPLPEEQAAIVEVANAAAAAVDAARRNEAALKRVGRALRARAFGMAEAVVPVEDLIEVTLGRQLAPQHRQGEYMVPYIRAANVKDGHLVLDEVFEMNFTPADQQTYALNFGDVLVTEGCGSLEQIGASAQWRSEIEGVVCFQKTLLRLRAKPDLAIPEFAYQWARWAFESGAFARISSGTNIFHVTAERAKKMVVPDLDVAEQAELVASLAAADAAASQAGEDRRALESLHDALRDALVTGQHRLPEFADATVLAA